MNSHDLQPDRTLSAEEKKRVEALTEADVAEIDAALLANACEHWRKVARVVGTTMSELPNRVPGIPDVYYSLRVQKMVQEGVLEAQGNLSHMRYSEVRTAQKK